MGQFEEDDELQNYSFEEHSRPRRRNRRGRSDDSDTAHDSVYDADPRDIPPDELSTIRCPECKKLILEDSVACPYCRHYVTDGETNRKPMVYTLTAIVLVIVFLWYILVGIS